MSISYGFQKHLPATSVHQAIDAITAALKQEGFGILTRIDVCDTLKSKLNIDFRHYVILGACNPHLAYQALTAEPQIGLMLPCNVVVQEAEGGADVSIADPKSMFSIVNRPGLASLAEDAADRLQRALASLKPA